jgi:hypothetical protein
MVLAADQQDYLSIPKVGRIKITAHAAVSEYQAGPFLTLETADGKLLERIDFALDGPEGHLNTLRFMILHQTSTHGPLIVALETTPAVSAVLFKAVILGFINGKVSELNPSPIEGQSINCLYFGYFGKDRSLGFLYFEDIYLDDGPEAHYDPHHYQAKLYEWQGNQFVLVSSKDTKKKYRYCEDAAVELGYHCQHNIFLELNPYSKCSSTTQLLRPDRLDWRLA